MLVKLPVSQEIELFIQKRLRFFPWGTAQGGLHQTRMVEGVVATSIQVIAQLVARGYVALAGVVDFVA